MARIHIVFELAHFESMFLLLHAMIAVRKNYAVKRGSCAYCGYKSEDAVEQINVLSRVYFSLRRA